MARRFTIGALFAVGVLFFASQAGAVGPTAGSGTFFEPSSIVTSFRQAGPVSFIGLQNVVQWSGPINGTAQETLNLTVLPSGDAVFSGVDVCACVASGGGTGTLTVRIHGQDSNGAFNGTYVARGAPGPLAGFHSWGTFSGFDSCGGGGVCGTYSGMFLG